MSSTPPEENKIPFSEENKDNITTTAIIKKSTKKSRKNKLRKARRKEESSTFSSSEETKEKKYCCFLNFNGEESKIIDFKSDAERKEWINLTKESKDLIYLLEIENNSVSFNCSPISGSSCDCEDHCRATQQHMAYALEKGIYRVSYS